MPILIATSAATTGRIPATPAKWPPKLQAMGYEAHFYELATGGHSYGKTHDDVASFVSLGVAFLRRAIGWRAN
jgi:prolyl oligopeptidase